jgi:hypothetical protein
MFKGDFESEPMRGRETLSSYCAADLVDDLLRVTGYFIPAPGDMAVRADQDEVPFVDFSHLFIINSSYLERNSGSLRGIREAGREALCESEENKAFAE